MLLGSWHVLVLLLLFCWGKTSFGKTKVVVEDMEVSRNIFNYWSQYILF